MMQLLNPIRRWFWSVKLTLIEREMRDVKEDRADALHRLDYGDYAALTEYHTDLAIEAMRLRARLGLSVIPNR
jgi:hypothetical protein